MAVIKSGPERYGHIAGRPSGAAPSSAQTPVEDTFRPNVIRFETPEPIPYREVDETLSLDCDVKLTCSGEYEWEILDGTLFARAFSGEAVPRQELAERLNRELYLALQVALAQEAKDGVSCHDLSTRTDAIVDSLEASLFSRWRELRGIGVVRFQLDAIQIAPDDLARIEALRKQHALTDPEQAANILLKLEHDVMHVSGGWYCPACGTENTGSVCTKCGKSKPGDAIELTL